MFEQVLSIILDSDKVEICQVSKGLNSQELSLSISKSIPAEIKEKGPNQVGEFIKGLCSDRKIQADVIYSALPCSCSMFRQIHLPFTDMNKIAKVMLMSLIPRKPYLKAFII